MLVAPVCARSHTNHANAIPELALRPFPSRPVHHREAFTELVNARESAALENPGTPLALHKSEAQQHHHQRAEFERVRHKLLGQLERWVRDDALATVGHLTFDERKVPDGCQCIITNPPFKLAEEFAAHALELCPLVMMLLRLAFMESERRTGIFEGRELARFTSSVNASR